MPRPLRELNSISYHRQVVSNLRLTVYSSASFCFSLTLHGTLHTLHSSLVLEDILERAVVLCTSPLFLCTEPRCRPKHSHCMTSAVFPSLLQWGQDPRSALCLHHRTSLRRCVCPVQHRCLHFLVCSTSVEWYRTGSFCLHSSLQSLI